MTGELERGRELAAQSREKVLELGLSVTGASMSIESTRVELLAGDPAAAAEDLRRDFETLDAMGETYFRSSLAGLLGHVLPALDRHDEAERFVNVAEELADADDVDSQVIWRSARAKLLARQGRADEAIAVAQHAVDLASTTDDIERQADALRDLAAALEIAGRPNDEGPSLRKALHLYEQKGDVVQAGRIRDRLARSVAG